MNWFEGKKKYLVILICLLLFGLVVLSYSNKDKRWSRDYNRERIQWVNDHQSVYYKGVNILRDEKERKEMIEVFKIIDHVDDAFNFADEYIKVYDIGEFRNIYVINRIYENTNGTKKFIERTYYVDEGLFVPELIKNSAFNYSSTGTVVRIKDDYFLKNTE